MNVCVNKVDIAKYNKSSIDRPQLEEIRKLAREREELQNSAIIVMREIGVFNLPRCESVERMNEIRDIYNKLFQEYSAAYEKRKEPRDLRIHIPGSAKSTDELLDENLKIITLPNRIAHIIGIHSHLENLLPVGIPVMDIAIICEGILENPGLLSRVFWRKQKREDEMIRDAFTIIFSGYKDLLEHDRESVGSYDPIATLCTYQHLRILTYVGGVLYSDDSLKPDLSAFEKGELKDYNRLIRKRRNRIFSLYD